MVNEERYQQMDDTEVFRVFRTSLVLSEVESAFCHLKTKCEREGRDLRDLLRRHVKELWNLIETRRKREDFINSPCVDKRVVVIGGTHFSLSLSVSLNFLGLNVPSQIRV